MIWYRINIDYIWNANSKNALEISSHAGKDKERAIELYHREINAARRCVDDETQLAKIDLTEYIYNDRTRETQNIIICKNY